MIQTLLAIGLDVLKTTIGDKTNTILAQLGSAIDGVVMSNDAEVWQQFGFASRPAKATKGQPSAQVLAFRQGSRDLVFAGRDTRIQQILGNLADGETAVFSSAGQGIAIFKNDGTVALKTSADNTATGASMMLRLSPTYGFDLVTPWGSINFGPTGFRIKHAIGVDINAYSIGGLPPPLSSISSILGIQAGIIRLNGQCLLGPYVRGVTKYMPAVWSPDPPGAPALIKGINSLGVKLSIP